MVHATLNLAYPKEHTFALKSTYVIYDITLTPNPKSEK